VHIILGKGQLQGPISGADETLITYAEQIKKAGHQVSVLLMYLPAPDDPYVQRLTKAGVTLACIASPLATTSLDAGRSVGRKLLNLFPASKKLIREGSRPLITSLARHHYQRCFDFIKQTNADVLHIITPDPSAMTMIRAGSDAGIPVIYHELGLPYHPPDFAPYYRQFTSVLSLCTEVAALSPKLLRHCQEELPVANKLSILPLMSAETKNGKNGWPARNGHVNFGFASRMEELKGPLVLMGAFGVARRRVPNVRLKIAGEGSQKEKVSALAKSLDVLSDYQYSGVYTLPDERARFMHDVDVFVLPSFTEGTPLCIIEAMAHSKPIIASAVGGIPDMIDSDSGILVPPGDESALSEAMTSLAQDPERRMRMGKAARERYVKLFSTEAVVPLILETYARLSREGTNGTNESASVHPWGRAPVR
jgi:glycosyltransferase involved in cell wall biosynthesis